MFGECEFCGRAIAVAINVDANQGMVTLCQCRGAYSAHEAKERERFQQKSRQVHREREPIKPRKVRRLR